MSFLWNLQDNIEWAKFKNDGFPQYLDLCIVFGDAYATGEYVARNVEENAKDYVVSKGEDNGVSGDNVGGATIGDPEEFNENNGDEGVFTSERLPPQFVRNTS